MRPPDLSDGKCTTLAPDVLEKTFWYPGPQDPKRKPTDYAQAAWEQAKETCIECPVFLRCREVCWGQDSGVMGGTDQYERYRYRRRLARRLAAMGEAERAQLAEHVHARHAGGLGDSPEVIARGTGYAVHSLNDLIKEHQAVLDAQRAARPAPAAPEAPLRASGPSFPVEAPSHGDGWVWHFGRIHNGHYVAETADGAYVRMKIKPHAAQTTKWYRASEVDLRVAVRPVVQTWIGRPDDSAAA